MSDLQRKIIELIATENARLQHDALQRRVAVQVYSLHTYFFCGRCGAQRHEDTFPGSACDEGECFCVPCETGNCDLHARAAQAMLHEIAAVKKGGIDDGGQS